jgi:hypothetical protein
MRRGVKNFFDTIKSFFVRNWVMILIVLIIIVVIICVVANTEGFINIPLPNGMTSYIKQLKDKSGNKASAIIEDANGNVIYSQTTQPVSRITYDYE